MSSPWTPRSRTRTSFDILPFLKAGDSNPFGLRFTDVRPLVGRCRPSGTGCPPGAGDPALSCRDVDTRVGVRVAGEAAGGTDELGLALARVLVDPSTGTAPQAGVGGGDVFDPAGGCARCAAGAGPTLGGGRHRCFGAVRPHARPSARRPDQGRGTAPPERTEQRHLKELRPGSAGKSEIRILFAFDPVRRAVLLVAGDKAGSWGGWHDTNIPVAEKRYQDHIAELETREYERAPSAGRMSSVEPTSNGGPLGSRCDPRGRSGPT